MISVKKQKNEVPAMELAMKSKSAAAMTAALLSSCQELSKDNQKMIRNKIVLAAVLTLSVVASAASAQPKRYIDPMAPFDGANFFESLPTGQ